jgi:hypothetical protein
MKAMNVKAKNVKAITYTTKSMRARKLQTKLFIAKSPAFCRILSHDGGAGGYQGDCSRC